MPAYAIANIEVHSPQIYENYRRHTAGTLDAYGGSFLIRGGQAEVIEGTWKPGRLVILEFPSMEALKNWYRSPAYQAIIADRHKGARSDIVAVEGFSPT